MPPIFSYVSIFKVDQNLSLLSLFEEDQNNFKITIKGVHPEMENDKILAKNTEFYPYIEHAGSIRNPDKHYHEKRQSPAGVG